MNNKKIEIYILQEKFIRMAHAADPEFMTNFNRPYFCILMLEHGKQYLIPITHTNKKFSFEMKDSSNKQTAYLHLEKSFQLINKQIIKRAYRSYETDNLHQMILTYYDKLIDAFNKYMGRYPLNYSVNIEKINQVQRSFTIWQMKNTLLKYKYISERARLLVVEACDDLLHLVKTNEPL